MSPLRAIGSLIPLLMVPHGRYEPEYQVGHTRIIPSNKNYVTTHIGDDITNGGLVNYLTLVHAARVTKSAVTSPVSIDTCSNERPPWPNFGLSPAPKCSAFGPPWTNGSEFEGDNFWSKAAELVCKSRTDSNHSKSQDIQRLVFSIDIDRNRQEMQSVSDSKSQRFKVPKKIKSQG